MSDNKDQLYQQPLQSIDGFSFDAQVANVFGDMIKRSVPGYSQILALLPSLIREAVNTGVRGRYYDLGCSLGAGMAAITQGLTGLYGQDSDGQDLDQVEIIGVDNSQAMLNGAKIKLEQLVSQTDWSISLRHDDILDTPLDNAAMILMNFTLQFLPVAERSKLINRCYKALNSGGHLVMSEKITLEDEPTNQRLVSIHHQFKRDQGYSLLEISQKRDAIEHVLIPETLETHTSRLQDAGFTIVTPWIQNLQFVSILAIK